MLVGLAGFSMLFFCWIYYQRNTEKGATFWGQSVCRIWAEHSRSVCNQLSTCIWFVLIGFTTLYWRLVLVKPREFFGVLYRTRYSFLCWGTLESRACSASCQWLHLGVSLLRQDSWHRRSSWIMRSSNPLQIYPQGHDLHWEMWQAFLLSLGTYQTFILTEPFLLPDVDITFCPGCMWGGKYLTIFGVVSTHLRVLEPRGSSPPWRLQREDNHSTGFFSRFSQSRMR